jgi:hypothetical protein
MKARRKTNDLDFNLRKYSQLYEVLFSLPVTPKKGPMITGGKLRYSLGDNVDVNCTSANSKPAAEINWFINGEPVSTKLKFLESIRLNVL